MRYSFFYFFSNSGAARALLGRQKLFSWPASNATEKEVPQRFS
jgi:hypothetical protein